MSKGDLIEMDGVIDDTMGGGQYKVRIVDSADSQVVRARLAGKLKLNKIQVIIGDKVRVAVSPYDLTHGLIVFRGTKR